MNRRAESVIQPSNWAGHRLAPVQGGGRRWIRYHPEVHDCSRRVGDALDKKRVAFANLLKFSLSCSPFGHCPVSPPASLGVLLKRSRPVDDHAGGLGMQRERVSGDNAGSGHDFPHDALHPTCLLRQQLPAMLVDASSHREMALVVTGPQRWYDVSVWLTVATVATLTSRRPDPSPHARWRTPVLTPHSPAQRRASCASTPPCLQGRSQGRP